MYLIDRRCRRRPAPTRAEPHVTSTPQHPRPPPPAALSSAVPPPPQAADAAAGPLLSMPQPPMPPLPAALSSAVPPAPSPTPQPVFQPRPPMPVALANEVPPPPRQPSPASTREPQLEFTRFCVLTSDDHGELWESTGRHAACVESWDEEIWQVEDEPLPASLPLVYPNLFGRRL